VNDTRDRILETALDLFIERGYDKTSLREIAERVGVTKAALYYHFSSKEEIVLTLVRPFFEHMGPMAEALAKRPDLKSWGEGLAAIIEWVMPQRKLFELLENNRGTLQELTHDSVDPETHKAFHEAVQAFFADETTPVADRMRMAASLGVLAGVLGGPAGNTFWRLPAEELQPLLIETINDVLKIG
jgi:AcrR family transcriptional regulator